MNEQTIQKMFWGCLFHVQFIDEWRETTRSPMMFMPGIKVFTGLYYPQQKNQNMKSTRGPHGVEAEMHNLIWKKKGKEGGGGKEGYLV